MLYQPKLGLPDSIESLVNCSPQEAQAWCNFVLFIMAYLPQGFTITKTQLRKESNDNPSSFRVLLENKDNQCISVKQFLYDWAPPAYDYPCLWLNTQKFTPDDFPAPRPIVVENRLLWIGKNYRGQNAATIDLERTRIEVTYHNINLADEELISLIKGFKPCDVMLEEQILNTPFSHLSYYFRHKKNASEVPLSYWRHMRLNSCFGKVLTKEQELIDTRWLPSPIEPILNKRGYFLESILEITTSTGECPEKEYMFEHHQNAGIFIHVLATPNDSTNPIKFPPTIGDQVCEHETIGEGENLLYLAHAKQKYGNYELIWKTKDMIYLMLIRAAPWFSYNEVVELSQKLQRH